MNLRAAAVAAIAKHYPTILDDPTLVQRYVVVNDTGLAAALVTLGMSQVELAQAQSLLASGGQVLIDGFELARMECPELPMAPLWSVGTEPPPSNWPMVEVGTPEWAQWVARSLLVRAIAWSLPDPMVFLDDEQRAYVTSASDDLLNALIANPNITAGVAVRLRELLVEDPKMIDFDIGLDALIQQPTAGEGWNGSGQPPASETHMLYVDGAQGTFLEFGDLADFNAPMSLSWWSMFLGVGYAIVGGSHVLWVKRVAGEEGWFMAFGGENLDSVVQLLVEDEMGVRESEGDLPAGEMVHNHFCITFDPGTKVARLFVDGVLEHELSNPAWTAIATNQPLRFGVDANDEKFSEALLGKPTIFDTVLSAGQVSAIAASFDLPDGYPIEPVHEFDLDGDTFADRVGNAVVVASGGVRAVNRRPDEGPLFAGRRACSFLVGRSIEFAGVFDFSSESMPWSAEIRVRRTPDSTSDGLISKTEDDRNTRSGLEVNVFGTPETGNRVSVILKSGVGSRRLQVQTDTAFAADVWTHIAVVYDGAVLKVYFDGTEQPLTVAVNNLIGSPSTAQPWRVGGNSQSGGDRLRGFTRCFGLHRVALTDDQVAEASATARARDRQTTPEHFWEMGAYGDVLLSESQVLIHDLVGTAHGTTLGDAGNVPRLVFDDTVQGPSGVEARPIDP